MQRVNDEALVGVQVMRSIARDLAGDLTAAQVADLIVGKMHDRFRAAATVVYLLDDSTRAVLAACRGLSDELKQRLHVLTLDSALPLMSAMRTGEPAWFQSHAALVAEYPELASAVTPREQLRAVAALPFLVDGKVLGGMAFSFAEEQEFGRNERELLMMSADLAAYAIDRARLIEDERRAKDQLAHGNLVKDQFLATLSHELRSPLNVISGWVSMLRLPNVPKEKVAKGLTIIERNVHAQIRLIEDVLDASRIVSGSLHIEPRAVSLWSVMEAASTGIRATIDGKNIVLTLRNESSDPHMAWADPARMQQVLANLLGNAAKFTPPGGRIDARIERDGSSFVITVADTGEGFEESFRPALFERFTQADGGTARKYGGLGLGLAISRHIVELHGGELCAHSAGLHQGATFQVRLPALPVTVAEVAESPRQAPACEIRGLRVLVCDDEADAREVLAEILRENGASVAMVASASEARGWLVGHSADVLLCDIGMPGEDGIALIKSIRALDRGVGASTPAIAVTAYASASDAENALAAGFQAYLGKPVDPRRLCDAICAVVPSKQSATSGPGAITQSGC